MVTYTVMKNYATWILQGIDFHQPNLFQMTDVPANLGTGHLYFEVQEKNNGDEMEVNPDNQEEMILSGKQKPCS